MADNVDITPGTGKTIAADDIGGVLSQRVKVQHGADGSATDVSTASPLPVTLANTGANTSKLLTTPDLPSGASTAANQTTANTSLSTIATNTGAALTDTQLRATAVPVSGTISTGLTQPLTDTQLRATAVPVSGSITANAGTNLNTSTLALETGGNLASIKAKTDNIPAQGQALSAASLPVVLPAAQITTLTPPAAITGYATSANQTTELSSLASIVTNTTRADTAPATQNITAADVASSTASGANSQSLITGTPTANSAATFALTAIQSVVIQVSGTWVATLAVEISMDGGTTWLNRGLHQAGTSYTAVSFTGNFAGGTSVSGYTHVRVRATAYTSGTATVKVNESANLNSVYIANSIKLSDPTTPSQQLAIGSTGAAATNVAQIAGTTTDTNSGTKSAGTQRIVIATDQPQLTNAFKVDGSAVTQPVSGTITANLGTGTGAVAGPTASGSSLTVNPLTGGGLAKTANPTAVSDGQVVNALHDKLGKQVVVGSIRDLKGVQQTTISASISETTIVTAIAATFLDLYGLILTNTSATATNVTIKDSTAGTTRAVIAVPAGDTRGLMLPESGGIPQATVNNNWTATSSASISSLQVTALYVKNI